MEIPTLTKRIEARQEPGEKVSVMFQKWRDLLFLHWEYEPDRIQKTLPDGLYVDTFDNKAYLGVTPFFMYDVRPRFFPAIKPISNFCEINVRTYVHDKDGNPGVYFYSLDADQPFAVELAKFFYLPYHHSNIESHKDDFTGNVFFKTNRKDSPVNYESEFVYKFMGEEFYAESGTLEFFLIERYQLFSHDNNTNQLYRGRVYHIPYPLFSVSVIKYDSNLLIQNGFDVAAKSPDHIIASSGVDVAIYNIEKISSGK